MTLEKEIIKRTNIDHTHINQKQAEWYFEKIKNLPVYGEKDCVEENYPYYKHPVTRIKINSILKKISNCDVCGDIFCGKEKDESRRKMLYDD
ncbi:MAG: hypothetical protein AABW81_03710 [Nanoarchaeota archaeon]